VAKVGTSNQDRTISLKAAVRSFKNKVSVILVNFNPYPANVENMVSS